MEDLSMKKIIILLSALVALSACNKETPIQESAIDPSKVVFDINVENANATKGIKTAWENGDVVYAFFEENSTQYVKMTYNGSSWSYKDKDGGTTFSGLTLSSSGKKVSAVYFPGFVCSSAPVFDEDKWKFAGAEGYFQYTNGVSYTVKSTSDVTTLEATIRLTAPANIIQVYIPSSEAGTLGSGNEFVLTATHIHPFTFSGVAPGGDVLWEKGSRGFPQTAYSGTIAKDAGYYFWGILGSPGLYAFDFQLVEQNAEKKYAISSKSKHAAPGKEISSAAIKLTGLTDNGKFVSLGYGNGPLWATGNLKDDGTIADPLLAGDYYKWCYTTPYDVTSPSDWYNGDYNTEKDPAYAKSGGKWSMPTKDQLEALYDGQNTNATTYSESWKEGWTNLGTDKGGMLIQSKVNGISLFLPAAGIYQLGETVDLFKVGEYGYYWSTAGSGTNEAYFLEFYNNFIGTDFSWYSRAWGASVRPVK